MNIKILLINLIVPVTAVLAIAVISGCFRIQKKESIKNELFDYFVKDWKAGEKEPAPGEEPSFHDKFFQLFIQAYEYEKYKESESKGKYYFYKLLSLVVLLTIPFLALFLITRQEWLLNDSEWNDIYLYTVVLVPFIFAFLLNKYIRIQHFREIWYRHMRNRHHIEWRMMMFVKDYELQKEGMKKEESDISSDSLKINFINDICEYWKSIATAMSVSDGAKEDNILEDIINLFGK